MRTLSMITRSQSFPAAEFTARWKIINQKMISREMVLESCVFSIFQIDKMATNQHNKPAERSSISHHLLQFSSLELFEFNLICQCAEHSAQNSEKLWTKSRTRAKWRTEIRELRVENRFILRATWSRKLRSFFSTRASSSVFGCLSTYFSFSSSSRSTAQKHNAMSSRRRGRTQKKERHTMYV